MGEDIRRTKESGGLEAEDTSAMLSRCVAQKTARSQREMNMVFLAIMFISSLREAPIPPAGYRRSRYTRPKE